jgi:hypothetical protein
VRRTQRYEISTTGFDPDLDGIDPSNGGMNVGLRVPAVGPGSPFMFMLARARFGANESFRIVGLRQLVTIGAYVGNNLGTNSGCNYPLEMEVGSSFWHFNDVPPPSWHLRRVPGPNNEAKIPNANNKVNYQFRDSQTPAVIFESGAADATYVAPNGGQVPGNAMTPDYANFNGIRFPWRTPESSVSLDIEGQGPCDIALYCLLQQTNPSNRCPLNLPASFVAGSNFLPYEDAFVATFSSSVYFRLAGSIIFESENYYQSPQEAVQTKWSPSK